MTTGSTDPAANTPVPLEGDGDELVGSVVDGRYRLDATLGRGGMGLVYRATHVKLRRPAAVKILHPSLAASPDVRSRFDREVLAAGRIKHPNCVETYDSGSLPDGSLYLAMELLEGRALSDILEMERQLATGRALHILAHVLRGLGHIHEAGLIHRDIKPENIFLIHSGEDLDFAKILDFGIAKPMKGEYDDGVRLTQAGMAFGTPIYMAPEQALGNKLDGRADLYAAAIIAYEMLCGQPPFYSEDKLEVMSMHAGKPVPPMRSRLVKGGKQVPSSIERLIVKGLTKKPGDRYANADIFLASVEAALATPDGGVTDVNFERPEETGARSLLRDDGKVEIASRDRSSSDDLGETIGEAIDEVLAAEEPTSIAPKFAYLPRAKTPRGATLPRNTTTPGIGIDHSETITSLPPPPAAMPSPTASSVAQTAPQPPVVAVGAPRGRGGGVGIGLPYTGPSGQPIFGLTPEQRLAQVPRKRRWPLYAAIVAAAVVAGVVIAIATKPSSGSGEPDPSTPVGEAYAAYKRGEPARALELLAAQPQAAIERDPEAQLVIGHARTAQGDYARALAAYEAALALDPQLGADETLRQAVHAMTDEHDPDVAMHAFDLWVGHTDDASAKPTLLATAASAKADRRRAAWPVVERYKLATPDLRLTALSLDLQQEGTCEQRKRVVTAMRKLGDPRAISALERATVRSMRRQNACLADDAAAAIRALRAADKKP